MNIKSLLIGSAAALVAFSGAQAADAIVAAEPEAVEYVKVCDAFGTGYFYIPGTETCLKISGYVRVEAAFGRATSTVSDYDIWARTNFNFEAKNDTEYGALTSFIGLNANLSNVGGDASDFTVEEAYIDIAGFRTGLFKSWWDADLKGETDKSNSTSRFAALRYTYTGEAFSAGLAVEELTYNSVTAPAIGPYDDANIGISAMLSGAFGPVKATVIGSYDFDYEEFALRGIVSAAIGPGTLEVMGIYASGLNSYYRESEWAVAAAYNFKATDKLAITPGFQYFGDRNFTNNDAWRAGVTLDYAIVSGLSTKISLQYQDADNAPANDAWNQSVLGFVRLERKF